MNTANPIIKGRKHPLVAAILNLIPLAGLAGCYGTVVGKNDNAFVTFVCLWLFAWGLGYLYLGYWLRLVVALIAPWVLCPTSFFFRPWDVEHPYLKPPTIENFVPIFIIVGSAVLITVFDAFRLANRYNAEFGSTSKESQPPN